MGSPKRQTLPLLPLCHWDGNWREPATVIRAIIDAIAEPNISTGDDQRRPRAGNECVRLAHE